MHPFLPFAVIPVAVAGAWFAATSWPGNDPARYRIPKVEQLENPTVQTDMAAHAAGKADIRVAAFLPHTVPKPAAPIPTLVLNSVLTGGDVNLASINGRLLRPGDQIKGYRVVEIAADGVLLKKNGKTRRLPMRALHDLPAPRKAGAQPRQAAYAAITQATGAGATTRSSPEIAQF